MTIKSANDILKLITNADFGQALIALSEIYDSIEPEEADEFSEAIFRFKRFSKEFQTPSMSYNPDTFRQQLTLFVREEKDFIDSTLQDKRTFKSSAQDDTYQLLCGIDFKDQKKYFDIIISNNEAIVPFIIRANQNSGQRWFYNQLINEYKKPTHQSLVIEMAQKDLPSLFHELSSHFTPRFTPTDNISKQTRRLRNALTDKLQTKSQFIIFKDSYSFVHSDEFDQLYDILTDFNEEIKSMRSEDARTQDYRHKCVFLFVESSVEEYQHPHYLSCANTNLLRAKQCTEIKLFDLDGVPKFNYEDLEAWILKLENHLMNCFGDDIPTTIQQLIENCENGNPEKVIPILCKKINQDYSKLKNIWLKY
ncbi:MAG: hypothetical protein ACPGJS_18850 [Flammeovirgaceae bacterium]